jgi:hypothetical protein
MALLAAGKAHLALGQAEEAHVALRQAHQGLGGTLRPDSPVIAELLALMVESARASNRWGAAGLGDMSAACYATAAACIRRSAYAAKHRRCCSATCTTSHCMCSPLSLCCRPPMVPLPINTEHRHAMPCC